MCDDGTARMFPALAQLMGAYFHQDFYEVHGGVLEALEDFIKEEPALASALPNEIEAFLETLSDDAAIHRELRRMGCCVFVGDGAGAYRQWLSEISDKSQ